MSKQEELEKLRNATVYDIPSILKNIELSDEKTAEQAIDEVYKEFETGDDLVEEIAVPVFMSIADGILSSTNFGKMARKKGLTASRVLNECRNFSYEEKDTTYVPDAYTESKNAKENVICPQEKMVTQEYDRSNYQDKRAMDIYKESQIHGEKMVDDQYTGKRNTYVDKNSKPKNYKDEKNANLSETDHIEPLKQIHTKYSQEFAIDDADIKRIANSDENFAMTRASLNDGRGKGGMTNSEYVKKMKEKGTPVDEQTEQNMLRLEKEAEAFIEKEITKAKIHNVLGIVDKDNIEEQSQKLYEYKIEQYKKKHGVEPSEDKLNSIKRRVEEEKRQAEQEEKERVKSNQKKIVGTEAKNAVHQAKDYAIGNVILYLIKPLYYEIKDIFSNGLVEGVNAQDTKDALAIRFKRVKDYVISNLKNFIGSNLKQFIMNLISSLIEGIINLFIGVFKQILKVVKEGVKIAVESCKILFGENSKNMSTAEKGDAILKLFAGTVASLFGILIETVLGKIGIGEPWSVILSVTLSGIASAFIMYGLNKVDLFNVKGEKRKERLKEVFDLRRKEINDAKEQMTVIVLEKLRNQRLEMESLSNEINDALAIGNIESLVWSLDALAQHSGVELSYHTTEECANQFDKEKTENF